VLENGLVSGNSQIELRVLTHYTQDPVLLEAYQTGQDIHTRTSLEVFGTDDPAKRRLSKIINFGLTYCLSSVGFARQARISEAEAEEHFARFHQRYAGIPAFRERFWAYVRQNGGTFANLFGRERHVPMINARLGKDRARAERQAIGALIQGQAAELTKESLCRIADWFEAEGLPALICQTIHDEIQIDTPIECLGRVAQGSKWIMENYPEFQPVPIVTGAAYSTENWARKKPLPGL
jgi:DNA polymerase-1